MDLNPNQAALILEANDEGEISVETTIVKIVVVFTMLLRL
jgi:hypothetical protein